MRLLTKNLFYLYEGPRDPQKPNVKRDEEAQSLFRPFESLLEMNLFDSYKRG